MADIKTKQTFGTLDVARFSPAPGQDAPRALNIAISFEEALKLHLGLGQALAKLNGYNRATTRGKNSAVNICVHLPIKRLTITETQLTKK